MIIKFKTVFKHLSIKCLEKILNTLLYKQDLICLSTNIMSIAFFGTWLKTKYSNDTGFFHEEKVNRQVHFFQ